MPPKKKGGKKGGKKKGKKGKKKDDAGLEIEEKYKKTMQEISALKDHLAIRKELTLRAQSARQDMRSEIEEREEKMKEKEKEAKAVSADMTRQYKTMQTQMGLTVHQLETELELTRRKLEHTEFELKQTREEKERVIRDKDEQISTLQLKIDTMGMAYENILADTMDNLAAKIDAAKLKWEHESTMIQARNKQVLLEFGLNPLDL
ncbi:dynein regulatory complex protein 12-like [Tubulanus polymorphus]|uniref:dynein regulatory complex protein 12-like n=1 Tax=Tubulanus polymorphus TaxID=672921 RepID=UPI003DA5B516